MPNELTPTGEIITMECELRTPGRCLFPDGVGSVLLYKDGKRRLWAVCRACADYAFSTGEWRRAGEKLPADQFVSEYELVKDRSHELGAVIAKILRKLLSERGIGNKITYRVKSLASLKGKLDRQMPLGIALSSVPDLVGIRVITPFVDDVARIGEVISQEFELLSTLSKSEHDRQQEDVFSYSSVHYIVRLPWSMRTLAEYQRIADLKAEIQVRSTLQQAWAQLEHEFQYKKAEEIPNNMQRQFARLAGLLEIADQEFVELRDKTKDLIQFQDKQVPGK